VTSSQTPILHGGSTTTQTPTRTTTLGLPLREGLTYHEWLDIGTRLTRNARTLPWMIGDWARYGEWRYGERYDQAIQITGLDYGTIANYSSVAGRFNFSRRRELLTIHHHANVQKLPDEEQDRWLDIAEQQRLSVAEMRDRMKAELGQGRDVVALAVFHVRVAPDVESRLRLGASDAGYERVEDWLIDLGLRETSQMEAA
jgi:hypothetical protein